MELKLPRFSRFVPKERNQNKRSIGTFLRGISALLLMLSFCSVYSQNRVYDNIQDAKNNNIQFQTIEVFDSERQSYTTPNVFYELNEVHLLDYRLDLSDIRGNALSFSVPLGTDTAIIDIMEVSESFYDYQVVTDRGERSLPDRSQARHFRGVVRGMPNSLVAISLFDDNVMGMISTDDGNFNIAKMKSGNDYIIYNDRNLIATPDFECETEDDDFEGYDPNVLLGSGGTTRAFETNCVRFYFETEFDIFQNFGTVVGVENYVTGVYNQVAIIYYNEGIDTSVSEINVWTTTDPYTGTNTATLLSQFQANTGAFNGDLGQLLTFRNAGGGRAAGFAGICNSNTDLSLSVSGNLTSTITPFPTYSWNVMVITHEFGHLFGSRHTHACVWNGNNTAIDGCAGFTEGSCALPGIPPTGGTIMSYCHIQTVGINFNNGFGLQPGNVIRDRVANGSCLGNCDPCPVSSTSFDIYTQDRPFDNGTEPNPDTGPMWISEDIWVRQDMDGGTTPENPEFKLFSPNGVYVKVRNRSTTTASECAVLKVYFSKASTGLQWPTHFNDFYQNVGSNSVLHGDIIGTATLPSIPPNGDITVEIPWYPPNPADYANDIHHFCLVSRILSPNDPMFSEVVGSVSPNVRNNNNIAWKNLSVYDATPGNLPPPIGVFVRGISRETRFNNIQFFDRGFDERVERALFDIGAVEVTIEPELFQRMREYGSLEGPGIEIVGENKVILTSREAAFTKVPLEYGETFSMHFGFKLYEELREREFVLFDIVQENYDTREFEGGERFMLTNVRERGVVQETQELSPSFDIVPNPNDGRFSLNLHNVEEGTYYIYDIYGATVLKGDINGEETISVDLAGQRANLFFVKVVSEGNSSNKVLVKK